MADDIESQVQLAQVFCEDFRVEDNGKPMMIGLLSPTVYGPKEVSLGGLLTVTFVTVPRDVEKCTVSLEVETIISGVSTKKHYSQEAERPSDLHAKSWLTLLPLDIDGEFFVGDSVITRVSCLGRSAETGLELLQGDQDK